MNPRVNGLNDYESNSTDSKVQKHNA